ncbi:hypothetical protein DES35_101766 [Schleiferia thermophila]|uniref:Uncharacterized protein n=1 Tax=Schleiferia thermophila TaxID=884107 RepID=A0A369A839_9FLAO|nr:hypothetical protein DES35_101766 [Schleiferia thermophila]
MFNRIFRPNETENNGNCIDCKLALCDGLINDLD